MRYYIAINMLITAGIGYVLRNANPGEFFNAAPKATKISRSATSTYRCSFPHCISCNSHLKNEQSTLLAV